jgi:hypothetical protein
MHNTDTLANTFTIGGVFAFIMHFSAELTVLVLLTGLVLNTLRIYDWFKGKNDGKSEN